MEFKKASREERLAKARAGDPDTFDRLMSMAKIQSPEMCWPIQTWLNKDGYGVLRVKGRKERAHRVMFSLFAPGVFAPVVRHTCNNPACINPAHLREGTPKDNAMDRVIAGRGGNLKGECNGRAKLTDLDVIAIRSSQLSGAELARQLGVSRVLVCRIRRGQAWPHVK